MPIGCQKTRECLSKIRWGSTYSGATGALLHQRNGCCAYQQLGTAVAGVGDVNCDGRADFIVGDPISDIGGPTNSGSVFVYSGSNNVLLYQKHGSTAEEWLGTRVEGAGDVNGDGRDDFIASNMLGSAFVYSGANGNLLYQKTLSGTPEVSGAGDVNADGRDEFVVIAANTAYVYSGNNGGLLYQISGVSTGTSTGDVDRNGRDDLVFGNPSYVPSGKGSTGAAFVYGLGPDQTPPSVTVTDPNGGEYVPKPCPYTITWNATDNVAVTGIEIRLDRFNDGIFEQQIANLSGNPGSYNNWVAGNPTSNNAKIKVIARDGAGNSGSDVSDNIFTIDQYCLGKAIAGLDINKDGVTSLVDVVMIINSAYSEAEDGKVNLGQEYIETFLAVVFSGSP